MTIDVSKVIEFEEGEMPIEECIDWFADLVKDGICWQLQGFYGRTAMSFIDNGFISPEGKVLAYPEF